MELVLFLPSLFLFLRYTRLNKALGRPSHYIISRTESSSTVPGWIQVHSPDSRGMPEVWKLVAEMQAYQSHRSSLRSNHNSMVSLEATGNIHFHMRQDLSCC